MRKQRIVLENHADIALVGWQARQRRAIEENLAAGGHFETRQHHQRCGLARARRPQHGQKLAILNIKIESGNDFMNAVKALADVDK